MTHIPSDLIDYLTTMISPPSGPDPSQILFLEGPWDLVGQADNSADGAIVRGTPTEDQAREILRVLKPGAHLMLIAPEGEPTGHTGACMVEDAGFEIRDSILWVREAGHIHYVPKASRTEREAGCKGLPTRSGAEAVDRKEDTAGTESPRAGAGRTAEVISNFHPTVKTIALMERLLEDVPKDQGPVMDPFLGSGTTGIACLDTGHDFIGVEKDADYIRIADARVRHWDRAKFRPRDVTIHSDAPPLPVVNDEPLDIGDLFGMGSD